MKHKDSIIEEVWKARELLQEQHGGIDGFLEYIKKQEQQHPERVVTPEQVKAKKNSVTSGQGKVNDLSIIKEKQ